jgi:toxin ParE1/3/4
MKVDITSQALSDLAEIHAYIAQKDGVGRANSVAAELDAAILGLDTLALRGHKPPELDLLNKDYLQILHRPWRIIYRLDPGLVTVTLVADGRRNFKDLLGRRILRGRK